MTVDSFISEFEDNVAFKSIKGFEGIYDISNTGLVKSLDRISNGRKWKGRIMKLWIDRDGYAHVILRKTDFKKRFIVHRLVAETFLSNPSNLPVINHKNGIKTDNRVENLEWSSIADNNKHAYETGLNRFHPESLPKFQGTNHPQCKLTEEDVKNIIKLRKIHTLKYISDIYNLNMGTVSKICLRKTWKHLIINDL